MVLVIGGTGYIGQAFVAELRRRGLDCVPLSRKTLDYTRFDVLFNHVRATKPEFVINAAGFTGGPDFEACESHRAETIRANTLLPQTIARICYLTRTTWGHVSSGGIYAGARIEEHGEWRIERDLGRSSIGALFDARPGSFRGFTEADVPNSSFRSPPCNFYSGSKALAEEALRWSDQGYIWRPGPVFDEWDHPRNFLAFIRRADKVPDGVNSLSHRGDFARACLDLWERHAPFGAYHTVNRGAIRTRRIVELMRRIFRDGLPSEFQESNGESGGPAAPVPRSGFILDDARLAATGIQLRPVDEAIAASLERWQESSSGALHGH